MSGSRYRLLDEMESWGAAISARVRDSGIVDRIFTDRVLLIIGYVTGADGPLQRMFSYLRNHGIGERVIKSTVAAVLAYWLASLIPGNPHPTFAPISAVFCINLTIAGGMHGAGQRVLGILAGILLAMFVHKEIDSQLLAVGLVVFIAFYIGRQLKLEPTGTQQITMTALLIIFIGTDTQFTETAWLRILNTMIGTAIGLLANASVAPTNLVPPARDKLIQLGESLAKDMTAISQGFREGITHDRAVALMNQTRQTAQQLEDARVAVDQAEDSLRFNLQARKLRQTLSHYRDAQASMTHTSFHSRTMARGTVDMTAQHAPQGWLAPEALGEPLADVVAVAADAVRARVSWIEQGDLEQSLPLDVETLIARQTTLVQRAQQWHDDLEHGGIFYLGEIVSLSVQLATEMSDPVDDDS